MAAQFLNNITNITMSHLYSNLNDYEGILASAPQEAMAVYSLWKLPTL